MLAVKKRTFIRFFCRNRVAVWLVVLKSSSCFPMKQMHTTYRRNMSRLCRIFFGNMLNRKQHHDRPLRANNAGRVSRIVCCHIFPAFRCEPDTASKIMHVSALDCVIRLTSPFRCHVEYDSPKGVSAMQNYCHGIAHPIWHLLG